MKLTSVGCAIGTLVALFLGFSARPVGLEIFLLPVEILLPAIIIGFVGLVFGGTLSAIAATAEKPALDGKPLARFIYFGVLGGLGGALLAIPLASTMETGIGSENLIARSIMILVFMMLVGGIASMIGVLTRKSQVGEKFFPWQNTGGKPTKPTEPTLINVFFLVAVLIGNARRILALMATDNRGFEAVLVVSIVAWFLIAYIFIRFTTKDYQRKLAAYEASNK